MGENKTWKNALVMEKSIKETKKGDEYFVFQVKQNKNDKYGKNFSWFNVEDADLEIPKSIKKNMYVDIEYSESEGNFNGKPVTYRNVVTMQAVSEMKSGSDVTEEEVDDCVEEGKLSKEEMNFAILEQGTKGTGLNFVNASELWIENVMKNDRIIDAILYQKEKGVPDAVIANEISTLSSLFIENCKRERGN